MDMDLYGAKVLEMAQRLLAAESPSGCCGEAVAMIQEVAAECGFRSYRSNKGNCIVEIPGREPGADGAVGLCAHVDTLGAMVRSITEKGDLKFTKVGGPLLPTLDGEYCKIRTRRGKIFTGTFLSLSPAAHVFPDAATRTRDEDNMVVRLDEKVEKEEDVKALDISAGDYIYIDPKTVVTESGFIKSRFLDDKGSSACLLTLMQAMAREGRRPRRDTKIIFTVYEEVGHGGGTMPEGLTELLAVDMGCIGLDMNCREWQVSICAKDNSGPYDYEMVSRLISLAKAGGVDFAVDIYPRYVSDVAAAWNAGYDVRGALIGPGVSASHGMERTHRDGLVNTMKLLALYLEL